MRTNLLVILTVTFFSFTINSQAQFLFDEDEQINLSGEFVENSTLNNLKDHVKQVTVFVYDADEINGKPEKTGYYYRKTPGEIYVYDKNGNNISYHAITDSLDFSEQEKLEDYKFEYNKDSKPVKKITIDLKSPESNYSNTIELYEYDDEGRISSYTCLRKNKELLYTKSYKYDKNSGFLSKYKTKNPGNKTKIKLEYTTIENAGLTCTIFRNNKADDILIYDNQGRLVERRESHSKIISRSPLRTKSYYDKIIYTYNERGDIVKKEKISGKLLSSDNYIRTYQYTYDKKSNWIKKLSFKDGNIYSIEEREIEYYE